MLIGDVGKFGITTEDLIDLSLKQPPSSGVSAADLTENISRAVLSAQGSLKARANPFKGFASGGAVQSQSLGNLRATS